MIKIARVTHLQISHTLFSLSQFPIQQHSRLEAQCHQPRLQSVYLQVLHLLKAKAHLFHLPRAHNHLQLHPYLRNQAPLPLIAWYLLPVHQVVNYPVLPLPPACNRRLLHQCPRNQATLPLIAWYLLPVHQIVNYPVPPLPLVSSPQLLHLSA